MRGWLVLSIAVWAGPAWSQAIERPDDALSRLGGPEAAGFLEFAARNEDEPERRAAAERALRRVADSAMVGASERDDRTQNRGHR